MKIESVVKEPLAPVMPLSNNVDYQTPEFSSPELKAAASKLLADLIAVQRACEQRLVDPQTARLQDFLLQMQNQFLQRIGHLQAEVDSLARGKEKDLIRRLRGERIELSRWLTEEIQRLVEDDKVATTVEAIQDCFERLDSLSREAKETILVVQEPERFMALLGDSFYVKSVICTPFIFEASAISCATCAAERGFATVKLIVAFKRQDASNKFCSANIACLSYLCVDEADCFTFRSSRMTCHRWYCSRFAGSGSS